VKLGGRVSYRISEDSWYYEFLFGFSPY
jgi:hypothetical protein